MRHRVNWIWDDKRVTPNIDEIIIEIFWISGSIQLWRFGFSIYLARSEPAKNDREVDREGEVEEASISRRRVARLC